MAGCVDAGDVSDHRAADQRGRTEDRTGPVFGFHPRGSERCPFPSCPDLSLVAWLPLHRAITERRINGERCESPSDPCHGRKDRHDRRMTCGCRMTYGTDVVPIMGRRTNDYLSPL